MAVRDPERGESLAGPSTPERTRPEHIRIGEAGYLVPDRSPDIVSHVERAVWEAQHLPQDALEVVVDTARFALSLVARDAKVRQQFGPEIAALHELYTSPRYFGEYHHDAVNVDHPGTTAEVNCVWRTGTERPETWLFGWPGWFGTKYTYANPAGADGLRPYSQLYADFVSEDLDRIIDGRTGGAAAEALLAANHRAVTATFEHLRERFPVDRAIYQGHSRGGIFGQHLAEVDDLFDAYVVINSTPHLNVTEHSFLDRLPGADRLLKQAINTLDSALPLAHRLWHQATEALPDAVAESGAHVPKRVGGMFSKRVIVQKMLGDIPRDDTVVLGSKFLAQYESLIESWKYLVMMANMPARPRTAQMERPVIVAEGMHDRLFNNPETSAGIAAQYPHAVHIRFDSGHFLPVEQAAAYAALVRQTADDAEGLVDAAEAIGTNRFKFKPLRRVK